jgi:4-amino-4-deoxy-L-arabinose transferase-like glycosyltransferase
LSIGNQSETGFSHPTTAKPRPIASFVRTHVGLIALLVVYYGVGVLYSVTMPIYEALDEFPHFAYVQHLVQGRGLPELDVKDATHLVHQEVAQPPLYYLVGALVTFAIPTSDLRDVPVNPHCRSGVPAFADNNRNLYIHGSDESFPYRGNALAVHLLRWLSLVMGGGVIIATYYFALRVKPDDRLFAVLASIFTGFNPQFLFLNASVNNDNLVTLLGNIGILLIIGMLIDRHTWRMSAVIGLITALAILAKPGGLAMIPMTGLAILILLWRDRSIEAFIKRAVAYFIPVVVLTGWWFVRNLQIYNEPFAFTAHQVFGSRSPKIGPIDLLAREGQGLWTSYWGVFGAFDLLAHPLMYVFFNVVTVLAIVGLLFGLIKGIIKGNWKTWIKWHSSLAPSAVIVGFGLLWLVVMIGAVINWSLIVPASQGRLTFPAIGAASTLLALGLVQWPFPKKALACVSAGIFICVALLIPFIVFIPAYDKPVLDTSISSSEIPNPVHVTFDNKLELLGYRLDRTKIIAGDTITVEAHWWVVNPMEKNYSIYVHALGVDGQSVGQVDVYPVGGAYRTSDLEAGQFFTDTYRLRISPEAKAPGIGRIVLGVYEYPSMVLLPAADGQEQPVHDAPAGTFKLQTSTAQNVRPPQPLSADFGQQIHLLGYDLPTTKLKPGEFVHGDLYWQANSVPPKDYTVFVQIVSSSGLIAQYDAQPWKGRFPTSQWERGDTVIDAFEIAIPSTVQKGQYALIAGLYDPISGERVVVNGQDHLEITNIFVE